jgi:hypothetical protein
MLQQAALPTTSASLKNVTIRISNGTNGAIAYQVPTGKTFVGHAFGYNVAANTSMTIKLPTSADTVYLSLSPSMLPLTFFAGTIIYVDNASLAILSGIES